MSTGLYNNTITIANGAIHFVPSGSTTLNPVIAESFSSSSFEVTCSANTNGHLAPTDSTGSFLMFIHPHGARLTVLYTTGSNPPISSSLYTPQRLQKLRGKHVTASINLGDSANEVALATFTALSKSLSDQHTRIGSTSFIVSTTGSAVTVTPKATGKSIPPIFNAQLTSSYGFTVKSLSTGSGILTEEADRPGDLDISQASIKLQFAGFKSRDLTISSSKGDVLFVSESGRIGIGTLSPKTQFDIRSDDDTTEGTKLLLRSSRGIASPLQVGDLAGELDFVVESGSFNNIETSGSIGKIKGVITSVNATGATGKIVVAVAKGTVTDSQDIVEWKYASPELQNFGQIMSASLLIQDYSTTLTSRLEIRKHDRTLYMSAESGSLYVKETGSFGLIEGGTF